MANAVKFKHTDVARQMGEFARLKVVQGPDYGAIFVILHAKVFLGRGEENDIVLSDLKASRIHAELSAVPGGWVIKDKGSANGILINGKSAREGALKLHDTFTLGETTLEFLSSEAHTTLLKSPARSINQVQMHQKQVEEQKKRISNIAFGGFGGSSTGQGSGEGDKKKTLYIIIGGVIVLLLMMGGNDKTPKLPIKNKNEASDKVADLSSFLPAGEANKTAETLFKDGMREYFAGNYNRARVQFETVLQILPNHILATLYLENCNKTIETEVKLHLENGKKAFDAGKLRDARAHFDRVMRLLFKDQANPAYLEAKDQYEKVLKQISGEFIPK